MYKRQSWLCLAFLFGVLILLTLENDTRQALMVTPLWFIALAIGWRFTRHRPATTPQREENGLI